ncbi:ferric iron reductase [Brevibacillus sp. SIMBA_040]|uniref:ferric iron reductase n=1 Tax=Brevibacillus sp. SIMBA_040 TaxID=3085781 RepID=UPI00397C92FE
MTMGEVSQQSIEVQTLSELMNEEKCRAYVEWLMEHIGSGSVRVASSMLVKRVANLLVAPVLSAATYYNNGIGIRPEHCHLFHLAAPSADSAFPYMVLSDARVTVPEESSRESWRAGIVKELFADCLTPFLKTVAAVGSVSKETLWENVMVRIAPVYSYDEEQDEATCQRMRDDFSFLAMNAPGELFGMSKNPLASFAEKGQDGCFTGRSRRLTCCLYYQMAPEYCLKCPKQ